MARVSQESKNGEPPDARKGPLSVSFRDKVLGGGTVSVWEERDLGRELGED
jgi:hypothetical protein